MPEEIKLPEHIENALGYSRNYARAKPNIGNTEKEHILGLANLLEKTALEAEALRKDAERYRWLCAQFGITKLPCAIERILGGNVYVADGKASIDAAIEVALAEEVQP